MFCMTACFRNVSCPLACKDNVLWSLIQVHGCNTLRKETEIKYSTRKIFSSSRPMAYTHDTVYVKLGSLGAKILASVYTNNNLWHFLLFLSSLRWDESEIVNLPLFRNYCLVWPRCFYQAPSSFTRQPLSQECFDWGHVFDMWNNNNERDG